VKSGEATASRQTVWVRFVSSLRAVITAFRVQQEEQEEGAVGVSRLRGLRRTANPVERRGGGKTQRRLGGATRLEAGVVGAVRR